MSDILVVGSANIDLSIKTDRFPKPGETMGGYGFVTSCGGKGANQAVAAKRCGGEVGFIGCVGNDIYASKIIENLKESSVDCSGVSIENTSTGVAVITVCNGENEIIIDSGANSCLTIDKLNGCKALFDGAKYVLSQLEIPYETVVECAKLSKEYNAAFVLNPAPFKALSDELLGLTDILILNEHEASMLTGIEVDSPSRAESAAKFLLQKVGCVIITLGKNGCVFTHAGVTYRCCAFTVKAVDSTGAGDCFTGALLSSLVGGEAIEKAVRIASAASAISVTRRGATDSFPKSNEIRAFLNKARGGL